LKIGRRGRHETSVNKRQSAPRSIPQCESLICGVYFIHLILIFMVQRPLLGQGLLTIEASRSHSVGLLWASDQPVAKTSTWQHTKLTRDRHPGPGGIRNHNPSKRAAADPRLRPRGHWGRLISHRAYLAHISPL
jgi:hypothetical protein